MPNLTLNSPPALRRVEISKLKPEKLKRIMKLNKRPPHKKPLFKLPRTRRLQTLLPTLRPWMDAMPSVHQALLLDASPHCKSSCQEPLTSTNSGAIELWPPEVLLQLPTERSRPTWESLSGSVKVLFKVPDSCSQTDLTKTELSLNSALLQLVLRPGEKTQPHALVTGLQLNPELLSAKEMHAMLKAPSLATQVITPTFQHSVSPMLLPAAPLLSSIMDTHNGKTKP